MAITINNGPQNIYSPRPQKEENTPREQTPQEKRKLREKQRLEKEQERLKERLKKLEKRSMSNVLKHIAFKIAQTETKKEPVDLFQEILPVLKDLGIHNIVEKNETELIDTKKMGRKQKNLYKILIRRKGEIESDLIKRIDRAHKNFEKMEWSSDGIVIYVWGEEYEEEEKEVPVRAPRPVPPALGP